MMIIMVDQGDNDNDDNDYDDDENGFDNGALNHNHRCQYDVPFTA